jgi:hypothetical protein
MIDADVLEAKYGGDDKNQFDSVDYLKTFYGNASKGASD